MLCELVCSLAFHLERGGVLADASSRDALLDAPVARGPERARRLNRELLEQAAAEAAQSKTPTSVAKLGLFAARFRKGRSLQVCKTVWNEACKARVARYYTACTSTLQACGDGGVVSISMDGTRMGLKEVLFGALWHSRIQQAAWCSPPPQVTGHRESRRIKKPETQT